MSTVGAIVRDNQVLATFTRIDLMTWYHANFSEEGDKALTFTNGDPLESQFDSGLMLYEVALSPTGVIITSQPSKEISKAGNQGYTTLDGSWIFYGYHWTATQQEAEQLVEQFRLDTLSEWIGTP